MWMILRELSLRSRYGIIHNKEAVKKGAWLFVMKELFRAEKIKCDYCLEDYHLSIYQGEIVYIQCVSDKAPDCLCDVVTGNRKPDFGQIFVGEKSVRNYNASYAASQGIYEASLKDNYEGNGTVAQALCPMKPFYHLYSERKMVRQVQKIFDEEGIFLDAGAPVLELDKIERRKLSLLRSKLLEAKLVVVNMNGEMVEGRQALKLGAIIQKMSREGITFLILSCNYSALAEYASRIQLLYLGRAVKEWSGEIPEIVFRQLKYGSFFARQGQSGELERNFIGLYDCEWDIQQSFWEYLRCLRENNPKIWEEFLKGELPEEGIGYLNGTAVVPGSSQELLFEELTIGQNLTIGASKRVNYGQSPFINRRIQRKMEEIYYDSQQISPKETDIRNLTGLQRKILSIERFAILRPSIIFLEFPYYDVGLAQIEELRGYLRSLVKRKIKVVYFSKMLESMMLDCKVIIHTKDGRSAKIDTL